jgi:16S rRNA (guanine1207-N2)-methyltransferase
MPTRKRSTPLSQRPVPQLVRAKARPPLAVVLGSPAEVVNLLRGCGAPEATCYQMDLYQADRLREELAAASITARVVALPDLWDLPAEFQSAVYMPARSGERELKIDMAEQAFHVLRPGGTLVVWSSYEGDQFFPNLLKKIYGRVHPSHTEQDTVLWSQRAGDRPRRRHEVTFQARVGAGPSCRFVSRPGTFSYGRFDDGARALVEVARVEAGERVLDVGCGVGTNGTFAAQRAGPEGFVAFVDSNVRAAALAELNARANGMPRFTAVASSTVSGDGLDQETFDVALANPPYYGAGSIAELFVARSKALLKPDGRLYLVTRQPNEVAPVLVKVFGDIDAVEHRGYTVLSARTEGEFSDTRRR